MYRAAVEGAFDGCKTSNYSSEQYATFAVTVGETWPPYGGPTWPHSLQLQVACMILFKQTQFQWGKPLNENEGYYLSQSDKRKDKKRKSLGVKIKLTN